MKKGNIFLNEESKNAVSISQLRGEVVTDFSSGYDVTARAENELMQKEAFNDVAMEFAGGVLELAEDNKTKKLDADVNATWHELELSIAKDPAGLLTPDGIIKIEERYLATKELIDEEISSSIISKKKRGEFMIANNDKQRSLVLSLQTQTMELKMAREVEGATANIRSSEEAIAQSYISDGVFINDVNLLNNSVLSYVHKGSSSASMLDKMGGTNHNVINEASGYATNTLFSAYSNEMTNLDTELETGVNINKNDLSLMLGELNEKLDGVEYDALLISDEFIKHAEKNGSKLDDLEKEEVRQRVKNNVSNFVRDKKRENTLKFQAYSAKENIAANVIDDLKRIQPRINNINAHETIMKSNKAMIKGDSSLTLSDFTQSPTKFIPNELANIVYKDVNAPNRILAGFSDRQEYYNTRKNALSAAGDIDGILALDDEFINERAKYIAEHTGQGRRDKLNASDFNTTFHETESNQTGMNMSIYSHELADDIRRADGYMRIAEASGFSDLSYSEIKIYDKANKDEFAKYGIFNNSDAKLVLNNLRKEASGRAIAEGKVIGEYWADKTDLTDDDLLTYLNSHNSVLIKDGVTDIYKTTEDFIPSVIDDAQQRSNIISNTSLNAINNNHSLMFKSELGNKILKRGYSIDYNEMEEFLNLDETNDYFTNLHISNDEKEAIKSYLKNGLITNDQKVNNIIIESESNLKTNDNWSADKNVRFKSEVIKRINLSDRTKREKDNAIKLIDEHEFQMNHEGYSDSERDASYSSIANDALMFYEGLTDDEIIEANTEALDNSPILGDGLSYKDINNLINQKYTTELKMGNIQFAANAADNIASYLVLGKVTKGLKIGWDKGKLKIKSMSLKGKVSNAKLSSISFKDKAATIDKNDKINKGIKQSKKILDDKLKELKSDRNYFLKARNNPKTTNEEYSYRVKEAYKSYENNLKNIGSVNSVDLNKERVLAEYLNIDVKNAESLIKGLSFDARETLNYAIDKGDAVLLDSLIGKTGIGNYITNTLAAGGVLNNHEIAVAANKALISSGMSSAAGMIGFVVNTSTGLVNYNISANSTLMTNYPQLNHIQITIIKDRLIAFKAENEGYKKALPYIGTMLTEDVWNAGDSWDVNRYHENNVRNARKNGISQEAFADELADKLGFSSLRNSRGLSLPHVIYEIGEREGLTARQIEELSIDVLSLE